ncbi:uncharacterized protein N0V89_000811 [Didymosphaeria variabile]|uniref:Xaa-Pro aminopeptidase n=1 Tax=Didymosphaeria variabile TaxID=1932322 RepID=A0A9W8XW08_9PLEO|nr:uncharacterized protein N0V89_000811 [Didymosphaeria variabile]KAJ4360251.1 hypothetical protein N0V89_000811 [Didymosphaeria variabile]
MEDLATNLDAISLAERLQGARAEEYWLHLEAEGPLDKYPAKQHARRVRERLHVAEGLIYLPGVPARSNEDSDMPAPFRQRRYFYYLSGCNEASCQLAYDIKRDLLTLFIPRVNPDRVFWNGRGSTPAEALDKYDVDEVFYVDQIESWIHDWFLHYRYDGAQRLYVLHKEQMPPLRYPWPVDSTALQPAVNQCRMIKDDHEIKLIRKANDISSKAHKQVLANITRFHNEAQVEGLFLNVCISNQAKQQAYDPIAASGPNAGTLHYDANNEDFADRQLMCLDAGCEFELYASDITRTFPLSGSWPSKEAENIYKLVERMQEACIQKLAPGVRYLDVHVLAHQIAIDGLLKLGLLHNGTREEIYKAGTSKAFFPHGLGHHVGLEVHDVGQQELMSLCKHPKYEKIPSLYPEDFHLPIYDKDLCMAPTHPQSPQLEEGMVVTVEPGIYFSAYALSYFYLPSPVHAKYINTEVLYRYFPVGGVRIEDDILITSKGYENLTTAPKGDAMFAIIKGQSTSSTPKSREKSVDALEESLRRAPGISRRVADPFVKPMQQIPAFPSKSLVDRPLREPFAPGHGIPSSSFDVQRGLNKESRGKLDDDFVPLPQVKAQRRSVTFDSYPITQSQLPSNQHEIVPAPSDWHTKSMDPATLAQKKQANRPVYDHPKSEWNPSNIPNQARVSKWTFTTLPEHVYPSAAGETSMSPEALARRSLSAAIERSNEREQYVHPANSLRRPDARPSLPFLRQGPASGTPEEGLAPVRSHRAEESVPLQNRNSTFVPVSFSAQEHDLRRRRSMGSALKSSIQSRDISPFAVSS